MLCFFDGVGIESPFSLVAGYIAEMKQLPQDICCCSVV